MMMMAMLKLADDNSDNNVCLQSMQVITFFTDSKGLLKPNSSMFTVNAGA